MILYMRILLSTIFIFSAVNKIYFYDVFSNGVRATGVFPASFLSVLIPAIIVIELLFGLTIFFVNKPLLLKLSSLIICVPMIIYNLSSAFPENSKMQLYDFI